MATKVGILTFHSSFNEGAILQAYCLAKNLQNNLPACKIEIVDHRYRAKSQAYGPPKDGRTRALSHFTNNSLPLSERRFEEDDHRRTFEYIRENYRGLIVGSDQVWKLRYSKRLFGLITEQKAAMYPAFPNIYWPDASIGMPKVAYAVSIGRTDWTKIPVKHRKKMQRILSDFSLLGIRDQRTKAFLEWLDPGIASRSEWVPDPTFSLDILSAVDKESLRYKLEQYGVDFSRPRLGVVVKDTQITNKVIEELKGKDFQIVGLMEKIPVSDVELFEREFTPLEWASAFGFMDLCLTQRMHGAISCILNDTPFVGISFTENRVDGESTLKDLMRSFNLLSFYYSGRINSAEHLRKICDDLIKGPWPSAEVREKRLVFQRRSQEFTEKIRQLIGGGELNGA